MHKALATGALAVALALAAGCRNTSTQSYTLDLAPTTGILALDVENFRGDVTIYATSDERTARVRGRVRIDGGSGKADKRRKHEAVMIDTRLEEDGARGVLRVRSSSAREEYQDHHVDLTIRVPRLDGLLVENSEGNVTVIDGAGATEIHTTSGAIQYLTSNTITDPVVLTAVDGHIYYQVPPGSTGDFDLETLDGIVAFRDRVTGSSEDAEAAPRAYRGVLIDDINPVIARTNNGDINVWVVDDPLAIRRAWPNARISIEDKVFQQTSRRYRRNLPLDHPEGTGPNQYADRRPHMDGQ